MVAHPPPDPGVYRYFALIDGCPAFYVVDYHGVQSELRVVDGDETEAEIIEHLSAALWAVRPRGDSASAPAQGQRPILRLL
jgi:hypothetical protein